MKGARLGVCKSPQPRAVSYTVLQTREKMELTKPLIAVRSNGRRATAERRQRQPTVTLDNPTQPNRDLEKMLTVKASVRPPRALPSDTQQ